MEWSPSTHHLSECLVAQGMQQPLQLLLQLGLQQWQIEKQLPPLKADVLGECRYDDLLQQSQEEPNMQHVLFQPIQ